MEQNNKPELTVDEYEAAAWEWTTAKIASAKIAAPAVDAAKLDELGKLKALAEAAEKGGQHVYTHPRDSNKFADNDRWHIAATPEAFLRIAALVAQQAARIAELERELRNADAIIAKLHSDIKEGK